MTAVFGMTGAIFSKESNTTHIWGPELYGRRICETSRVSFDASVARGEGAS